MGDPLEIALYAGAALALRNRAHLKRKQADDGAVVIEGRQPPILIFSPEARLAARMAGDWDAIADELEAEGRR